MNSASFVLLAVFATLCINLPILTARSVPEAEAKRHKRDQDNHQGSPGQMKDDNPFGVIGLTKYKNPKWLVNNHDKKLEIDNNGTVKGSSKFTRHGKYTRMHEHTYTHTERERERERERCRPWST